MYSEEIDQAERAELEHEKQVARGQAHIRSLSKR
jgi:hypothetical protein